MSLDLRQCDQAPPILADMLGRDRSLPVGTEDRENPDKIPSFGFQIAHQCLEDEDRSPESEDQLLLGELFDTLPTDLGHVDVPL